MLEGVKKVFHELLKIRIPKLKEHINRLPENTERQKLLKAQAMELLKALIEYSNGQEVVNCHC